MIFLTTSMTRWRHRQVGLLMHPSRKTSVPVDSLAAAW